MIRNRYVAESEERGAAMSVQVSSFLNNKVRIPMPEPKENPLMPIQPSSPSLPPIAHGSGTAISGTGHSFVMTINNNYVVRSGIPE